MAQTFTQRERRNTIAAWLLDRFGPEGQVTYSLYWKDADDLIKFLKANGFTLEPIEGFFDD